MDQNTIVNTVTICVGSLAAIYLAVMIYIALKDHSKEIKKGE